MRLQIAPGESVTVCFGESDGEITVSFCETEITVHANLPDTTFNREGVIYREVFVEPLQKEVISCLDI